MKSRNQILLVSLVGLWLAIQSISVSGWRPAAAGVKARPAAPTRAILGARATVRAAGRGNPWINLRDGHDLLTAYTGAQAEAWLASQAAQPLALAAGDFDEDGVPDLLSGYDHPGGGLIVLQRGNVDAIYPDTPAAEQRRAAGEFTEAPFLSPARVFALPAAADFVGAGDFNADGHVDVVAATRGSATLYWLAGDGRGGLGQAQAIELPGSVTALVTSEINRADGLTDVIVGIHLEQGGSAQGAQALVFEGPEGAFSRAPEVIALPAEATALALGQLDEQYEMDLAVAAGHELLIVHGRDRCLSVGQERQAEVKPAAIEEHALAFHIVSLAVGDFSGDERAEIAVLSADGVVQVLGQDARSKQWGTRIGEVATRSQREAATTAVANDQLAPLAAPMLVRARVSVSGYDDLVVVDRDQQQLQILTGGMLRGDEAQAAAEPHAPVALAVEGEPVAVLPMRLNMDALSDLVVLKRGGESSVAAALTAPTATFTVNDTGPGGDARPGDGKCETVVGNGKCNLLAAIQETNASAGADLINFSVSSITLSSLPNITDVVTIDGGANRVEISGPGLTLTGGNSVIQRLVLNRLINSATAAISLSGKGNNRVEGCYIGTDAAGANEAFGANFVPGVRIDSSPSNTIGGTTTAARNILVSFGNGVRLLTKSPGNKVQGNYIGTDVTGTKALVNSTFSNSVAAVNNANDNQNLVIGGTDVGAGNVLSGGVFIQGESGVLIQGNLIGTNRDGTVAFVTTGGNGAGVRFDGATGVTGLTVGGTTLAARNVISGWGFGIQLQIISAVLVQGNHIGTDKDGTKALGNYIGVQFSFGVTGSTLGGTVTGARNLISGSTTTGAGFFGTNNSVLGNYIGTDVNGTANLGNTGDGVVLSGNNNRVGGTESGAANIIAFNRTRGVDVSSGGNTVSRNSIFSNGAPGSAGGGIFSFTKAPVLTTTAGTTQGTLSGATPNTPHIIEFFSNPTCATDTQGKTYISVNPVTTVTTNASGAASFDVPAGQNVTATATATGGSTSPFSNCVAPPPALITLNPSTLNFNAAVEPLSQTVTLTNTRTGTMNWVAQATTNKGGAWLSVIPTSGSLASNQSTSLNVTVDVRALASDLYSGSILVSSADASNSPQRVTVSLEVPDFTVSRIEPVQVIQDATNSVQLVARKSTVARIFVGTNASLAIPDVTASLRGFRDGTELPGSPLTKPLNNSFSAPPMPLRANINDSINFLLPRDWTKEGKLKLEAEVKPPSGKADPRTDNNKLPMEFDFHSRNLLVRFVRFTDLATGEIADLGQAKNAHSLMRWLWPVSSLEYTPLDNQLRFVGPNIKEVLSTILARTTIRPDVLYGWLPHKACSGTANWESKDKRGEPEQCFEITLREPIAHSGLSGDCEKFALTHEEGHAYLLAHPFEVTGGVTARTKLCGAQRVPDHIEDLVVNTPEGLRLRRQNVDDWEMLNQDHAIPRPANDVVWISQSSWKWLFDRLPGPRSEQDETRLKISQADPLLLVRGTVSKAGQVSLKPIYPAVSSLSAARNGPYCFRLEASGGQVLRSHCFDISALDQNFNPLDPAPFIETIPQPAGLAKIVLVRDGRVLFERRASPRAPVVTFTAPAAGQTWDGINTARWTARDEDGDSLRYLIEYSPDDRSTWILLEADLEKPEYVLNSGLVPGGDRFWLRVVATDGFNATTVEVGPLRVSKKGPDVSVLTPPPNALVNVGTPVLLEGTGFDLEDGGIPEEGFTWSSDRDGLLGSGNILHATNLSLGDHLITLRGRDRDGNVATASVNVHIIPSGARTVTAVSAASFSGQTLAAEAIVAAFSTNLATGVVVANTLPLPTSLAGTTVRVRDSLGVERLAPLFFVAPQQINFLIPAGTATGTATITVTSGDGALSLGNVTIAAVAPGLFTANANGQGVPAAVALRVKADGTQSYEPVARFDAAQNRFVATPIDLGPASDQVFLLLFGTGLRFNGGLAGVTCKLGGVDAQVSFAGAQGDLVGLDQVNLAVPRTLAGRGEVDLVLTVDGSAANTVRVAFAGGPTCNYTIAPASQSFAASGGAGSVNVTAPNGCAWTATSNANFITITGGASGTGNGTVNYSVAANTTTSQRTGTLTIAGQTFTLTQAALVCTYAIAPNSQTFNANANTGSVNVTANSGCTWTATSNANFLTITSGASGNGNGVVNYSVAANTAISQRTGTLTIAGQTFTVTQAAAATTVTVRERRLTGGPIPDQCSPPTAKTAFLTTDAQAYQWTLVSGANLGDVVRWEFVQPSSVSERKSICSPYRRLAANFVSVQGYQQLFPSCLPHFLASGHTYPRMLCSRLTLNAKHTRHHSPAAPTNPRNENCRNPKASLMIPITGSTVLFRKP